MKHIRIDCGPFINFYYLDTYYQLEKEIQKKYNLTSDLYFITSGGKLIKKDHDFNKSLTSTYQLHIKMKGGLGIGGDIMGVLDDIAGGFKKLAVIGDFFKGIPKFFKWVFVDLFKWLFIDFLHPYFIAHDIARGVLTVLRVIILTILDVLSGIVRSLVNLVFEPIISGFWGYTPSDKEINKNDKSEAAKCAKGKRCFEQPKTKVAFPVLISTIILPPLGLFMELGLKGWMNLLLCAILTLFYYFPGLIYALIILYC